MPEPLCSCCGVLLPDATVPGPTTCRQWVDAVVRHQGDLLSEDLCRDLELIRVFCALYAAIRDGEETIDP
jgi:hypothetical protein